MPRRSPACREGAAGAVSAASRACPCPPPGCSNPGPAGLMEGGPRMGGGMLVGPGDPMFGPGRMGGGVGGPPGHALPPGARWDPIGPPGLPGFHPGALCMMCALCRGVGDVHERGGPGLVMPAAHSPNEAAQAKAGGTLAPPADQSRPNWPLVGEPPDAAASLPPADDFQPPPPGQIHPDVAQPGPRGTDWDRMFG